jgi:hypothetical protein
MFQSGACNLLFTRSDPVLYWEEPALRRRAATQAGFASTFQQTKHVRCFSEG